MEVLQTSARPRPAAVQALLTEAELANADCPAATNLRHGRIAGVLFIAGGIAGTPAIALQGHPPTVFLLTLLALVSGAICLLAPWRRLSPRWIHLVCAVASLEVFAVAVVAAPEFAWYYTLVGAFAAYVFPTRQEVAAQLAFAVVLMFTAAAIDGGEEVVYMVIAVPALITATALIRALREELERGRASYRMLSRRDGLTGVGNYRQLHEAIAEEVSRHERSGDRFALIVLDIDRFKQVNDDHGHLEGDRVLREVATAMAGAVRNADLVARHGGDEFAVVAPALSNGGAEELCSRVKAAAGAVTVSGHPLAVTAGWAVYPDHGGTPDELFGRADTNLREQKGRRRPLIAEGQSG